MPNSNFEKTHIGWTLYAGPLEFEMLPRLSAFMFELHSLYMASLGLLGVFGRNGFLVRRSSGYHKEVLEKVMAQAQYFLIFFCSQGRFSTIPTITHPHSLCATSETGEFPLLPDDSGLFEFMFLFASQVVSFRG